MKRDVAKIKRVLDDTRNNDIILKKAKIMEILESDPDLKEVLGKPEPRPLNHYEDPDNPTEEELQKRKEILDYNEKLKRKQILPYLKINDIQTDVQNYILFDIQDKNVSYDNQIIKYQYLVVICFVQENDMDTEYGIARTDLLSYIIRDLFSWSNVLGVQMKLTMDNPDISDSRYYTRTLNFLMNAPNVQHGYAARNNRYDRLP
jgi:hypothetical protein